jgi:tRNA modification GTPase
MDDTIFALSSGAPPAAIAIVRISGPGAGPAVDRLTGGRPTERLACVRNLFDAEGELLDRALVLWMPGPGTSTGEDITELHVHGGRAVIAAVERSLEGSPGLRRALPGEFTRRAFTNGRIDLAEAEGLADLLSAETDLQRRQALALAGGDLSKLVREWRDAVLCASAEIEAILDFGDEDDVQGLSPGFSERLNTLAGTLRQYLDMPRAEALRDGFRVVLAGPPNSGKSSLFNRLVDDDAAITAPIAGTTRDVLTRPVALAGIPFVFVDTAGLREHASDTIEAIGIDRAKSELSRADLVLWLGEAGEGAGQHVWDISSFGDLEGARDKQARHSVSAVSGRGLVALQQDLVAAAQRIMPQVGSVALNQRQHQLLTGAATGIEDASRQADPLLTAESLRYALREFDSLLGYAGVENMLDTLFARFCIGK